MAEASHGQQLRDLVAKGVATEKEAAEALRLLEEAQKEGRELSVADALVQAASSRPSDSGDTLAEDPEAPAMHGSDLQLLERIGRGSQAVVFKCRQVSMDRTVAVKFLHVAAARDAESRQRFVQEARHAASLSHPNIVTIHAICPYKDTFYIVMEYVDGGSLAELLALRKRFDVTEAVGLIRAVAEGLACAHRAGVIHRDVKPKNILLTQGGIIKLADLGLARRTDDSDASLDKTGKAYGTPYYIAPEQVCGDPNIDARADIYSLGATFYEMLTGRPPFSAPTPREIMRKQVTEPLPDPRQYVPDLSPAACAILDKCLAKRREDRFPTADAFVEAIDQAFFATGAKPDVPAPQDLLDQIAAIAKRRVASRRPSQAKARPRRVRLGRTGPATARGGRRRAPPAPRGILDELNRAAAAHSAPLSSSLSLRAEGRAGKTPWVPIGVGAVVLVLVAGVAAIVISENTKTGTGSGRSSERSYRQTPGTYTPIPMPPAPSLAPAATQEPPEQADSDAAALLKQAKQLEARKAFLLSVIQAYEFVVKWHPNSPEAKEAREAIDRLGGVAPESAPNAGPHPEKG
jgi:serine/threonine-protein kinase